LFIAFSSPAAMLTRLGKTRVLDFAHFGRHCRTTGR